MRLTRIAFAVTLAGLAGCDSPTSVSAFEGALSFTYSGGYSGTFSATGAVSVDEVNWETAWAGGAMLPSEGAVQVVANTPRSSTSHDFLMLYITRTTVGSESISSTCTLNCTSLYLIVGSSNTGAGSFLRVCSLESGTFAITEINSMRAQGTFSGTGTCTDFEGADTAFTVTNGTFDVPLLSEAA